MSDLIQIQLNSRPWQPSTDTEIVEILDEYDIPLLLIVNQNGTDYMARCVLGQVGSISIWIYRRLDVHEVAELRGGSSEQISETADYVMTGYLTAALVRDDKVVYSTPVMLEDGTWQDRLQSALSQLQQALDRAKADGDHISENFVRAG